MSGNFPRHLEEAIRDTLGEIAGGAFVDFDSENYPRLYRNVAQPSQEVLSELLHYGWLEPNLNGRGYRLKFRRPSRIHGGGGRASGRSGAPMPHI